MQNLSDFLGYDDEYINGLATDWFFLNMFFATAESRCAERVVDPLIEVGMWLKLCLWEAGHTYSAPRNICADEDLYLDIWLDADGDIQVGDLYTDERENWD